MDPLFETDEEGRPNRIVRAIHAKEESLDALPESDSSTPEMREKARQALDFSFEEYVRFQELKSQAVLAGLITLSEGLTIFHYLGSIPDTFNQQSLAVKAVLTGFLMELLNESR